MTSMDNGPVPPQAVCDKCDRDKYANYKGITPGNEHLHKYKCYHFNNYKTRNLNPSEFNEPSIYFVHFHV